MNLSNIPRAVIWLIILGLLVLVATKVLTKAAGKAGAAVPGI